MIVFASERPVNWCLTKPNAAIVPMIVAMIVEITPIPRLTPTE